MYTYFRLSCQAVSLVEVSHKVQKGWGFFTVNVDLYRNLKSTLVAFFIYYRLKYLNNLVYAMNIDIKLIMKIISFAIAQYRSRPYPVHISPLRFSGYRFLGMQTDFYGRRSKHPTINISPCDGMMGWVVRGGGCYI